MTKEIASALKAQKMMDLENAFLLTAETMDILNVEFVFAMKAMMENTVKIALKATKNSRLNLVR